MWVCASLGLGPGLTGFAACLAGLLPYLAVKALIARRERAFAHGIEILAEGTARGLDSGLGLGESVVLALEACPQPVAASLRPAASGLFIGQPVRDFAEALRGGVPLPAALLLAAALTAGSDSGGQMSETMRSIAACLRDTRRSRKRLETAAAEARSASAMLMALPVMVVAGLAAVAPSHFALLTGTPSGQAALTLSALWLLSGYLVMRRIVAAALPDEGPGG
jgi:tight adherence protein B